MIFCLGLAIGILGGIILDAKFLQSNLKETATIVEKEEDNTKDEGKVEETKFGTPVEQHGQLKVDGNKIVDKEGFKTLRDDWNTNCVRLAMYTDNNSSYPQKKEELEKTIREGINFFREIATEYKNYLNMIYELCNEPNGNISWDNDM